MITRILASFSTCLMLVPHAFAQNCDSDRALRLSAADASNGLGGLKFLNGKMLGHCFGSATGEEPMAFHCLVTAEKAGSTVAFYYKWDARTCAPIDSVGMKLGLIPDVTTTE